MINIGTLVVEFNQSRYLTPITHIFSQEVGILVCPCICNHQCFNEYLTVYNI